MQTGPTSTTSSLGGTWGAERKLQLTTSGQQPVDPKVLEAYTSVNQSTYTIDSFTKSKSESQSKFHKFVSIHTPITFDININLCLQKQLQQNGSAIVSGGSTFNNSAEEAIEDANNFSATFSESPNHSPSRKSKPGNVPLSPKPFSTTYNDCYKAPVSIFSS